MNKSLLGILIICAGLSACDASTNRSNDQNETAEKATVDQVGADLLKSEWGKICEKIDTIKVVDTVTGTASANNHPAHVIGYNFRCVNSMTGNKFWTIYVGWMENLDINQYQCVHMGADKNRILSEGWWECGGNFRATGN